jgi:hypothetical protein
MDYRNAFFKTIGLSEYRILGRQVRKTIGLSDIGYQTQTIRISDIRYKKNYLLPSAGKGNRLLEEKEESREADIHTLTHIYICKYIAK